MLDFKSFSPWVNVAILAGAGVAIWVAGTVIERNVDAIAERTGLGKAFLGAVMLAVASSLPEIATVVSATATGSTELAVHNLFGSVVLNTAILAVADIAFGRQALSHKSAHFSLLIAGTGVVFVIGVALVGMALGEKVTETMTAGQANWVLAVWCLLIAGSYAGMLYVTHRSHGAKRWRPTDAKHSSKEKKPDDSHAEETRQEGENEDDQSSQDDDEQTSLTKLILIFLAASAVVLAAGYAVSQTGDALAEQTGLGQTFLGFTLVAVATSLPEMSMTISAARSGHFEAAFSNIFGSNAFTVALLVLVAVIAGGMATFESLTASAQFAAAVGICMVCVYLWGLLERGDRTVWRMGYDSVAVLVLAVVGIAGVYWLD